MLRYFFLFLFFLFHLVGCNDFDDVIEDRGLKNNLIQTYLDNANDEGISKVERKKNLEKAYSISSTLEDNSGKVEKIHDISLQYYLLEDFENFKYMNEKALKLAKFIKDSLKISKSYFNIGIYYRASKLDIAYKNFYEAEKIYSLLSKSRTDKKIVFKHGTVLIDMARIRQRTKDYAESEAITIRAIEKFKLSEDKTYLPLCYTNLGILAKYLERYEESVDYHLKAIEYSKGLKSELSQRTISYNNIGTVYKSQNKYEEAKDYYKKGLSYKKVLDKNKSRYALLLDNLAYVNFLSNDTSEIPSLFYEALRIREAINNERGIITNCIHLAEYYRSINNDSIAISYAKRARDIALKLKENEELSKAYKTLTQVSNSEDGLKYANKYIKLSDSLVKEERLYRDKFARIKFETDEIAEENLQMSKENQILIIAILGLTALFLLGYIIFRQQQSNKELLFAQSQQESNQEIYRLLLNQQIKLEEGRQLEQQRMSEELHDGVLGRLFGVRLSLDGINQRANDGFTEARNKYIDELKSIEKEIRLISHDLGTDTLPSDVAYIDAIESLISDLCEVHKIDFEFYNDEDIDWEEIDDQKKVNFFRILQESMQNIFKHASAKSIKINFDYLEDKINLTILDDGIGFRSSKVKKGIGLKNITSRVGQMSGVVQFLSNKDTGTKVSVSVPV